MGDQPGVKSHNSDNRHFLIKSKVILVEDVQLTQWLIREMCRHFSSHE